MVIAKGGHIHAGTAVAQNTNAVAIQSANDGATCVRSEISTADTWQLVQCFTQGALALLKQRQARQTAYC